jgi:hypothetical protein
MKRVVAVALLVFAVGCAAKGSGGRGGGTQIQRVIDESAQRDHGDFSRPIGQR